MDPSQSASYGSSSAATPTTGREWAASMLASATMLSSGSSLAHAQPAYQPYASMSASPFAASGSMFGVQQDAGPYRSTFVPNAQQPSAFSPLEQPAYQARAVDIHAAPQQQAAHGWFQPHDLQSAAHASHAFGFGSVSKSATTTASLPEFTPSPKELSLPRIEALIVNAVPIASAGPAVPALPVYVENTCFSCAAAACQPTQLLVAVQDKLAECGVICAATKPFRLHCSSSFGTSTCEFAVRCYSGHYRSCGSSPADDAWVTVEFQRLTGCCMQTMELFRHILTTLPVDLKTVLESRIACVSAEAPGGGANPGEAEDIDLSDLDLAALAPPSLTRGMTASHPSPPMRVAKEDSECLFDALLDMITSSHLESQLQGLNALALCFDGEHPKAGDILQEVAAKLQHESALVKQTAAKLIAQLAETNACVAKHCLPVVLAQLTVPQACAAPLDAAYATAVQKQCLKTCVSLSSSVPSALDGEGVVQSSRLKRELLRMTAAEDHELRSLATQTIRAIQV